MKRTAVFLLGLAAFGTVVAWVVSHRTEADARAVITLPDGAVVYAEIADTANERRVGLSKHLFLDQDRGMLFLFEEAGLHSFWMKDMDFPIDILWIAGETVVGTETDVPVSDSGELPTYSPTAEIDRVLEMNAGFAVVHGLKTGDHLDIDFPEGYTAPVIP